MLARNNEAGVESDGLRCSRNREPEIAANARRAGALKRKNPRISGDSSAIGRKLTQRSGGAGLPSSNLVKKSPARPFGRAGAHDLKRATSVRRATPVTSVVGRGGRRKGLWRLVQTIGVGCETRRV